MVNLKFVRVLPSTLKAFISAKYSLPTFKFIIIKFVSLHNEKLHNL